MFVLKYKPFYVQRFAYREMLELYLRILAFEIRSQRNLNVTTYILSHEHPLAINISKMFWGPLGYTVADRITYELLVDIFPCVSTAWPDLHWRASLQSAFRRPFTPVACHFLALNLLDSSAINWAKVDTTYGISSTKIMRKFTEVSAKRYQWGDILRRPITCHF